MEVVCVCVCVCVSMGVCVCVFVCVCPWVYERGLVVGGMGGARKELFWGNEETRRSCLEKI